MMTISGSMTVKIKTIDNGTKLQSQKVSPLMEGGNIFSLEGLRAFDEDTEKLVDFFCPHPIWALLSLNCAAPDGY